MPSSLLRPRRLPSLLVTTTALIFGLFYLLLTINPCVVGAHCYHGYHSPHSFDADKSHRARWMADLPDDVYLSSLSVPGTHDSMTDRIGSQTLECQNWNISVQLGAGLRYFDIRARLREDELHIYHGNGYTGYSFEDVLLAMFDFLDENPSETIIMRLKEEGKPVGENTISFEDAFNYHRRSSPNTSQGASKHLQLYDRIEPLPTLGALRSKIFILQQFEASDGPYGLEWDGPQMALEDLWIIPDVYHLSEKWTAIREALNTAATAPHDNKLLYFAHLSASVGILPIEGAAGPMNRTIQGMNDMTGQWLKDFEDVEDATRTGVVIIDFPGKELIEAVLRWNLPLMVSS